MSGYTALPSKSPGDLLTSALWNTYLKGNADSGFCRMIADAVVVGGPPSGIDFTSIPSTFAHLAVFILARGDTAAPTTSTSMRFNNDGGTNYENVSSLTSGTATSGLTSGKFGAGLMPAGSATAGLFAAGLVLIPHYAQATSYKTWLSIGSYFIDLAAANGGAEYNGVWYAAAAAINRITFFPGAGNFDDGTRITLYGLPA